MKQNDLEKEKYYFLQTKKGHVPIVTVCLIKSKTNEYARGISILSFRDALSIHEGKRHARAAAMEALGTKKIGKKVNRSDVLDMLSLVDTSILKVKGKKLYKSIFNPSLTKKEKELLGCDNKI